MRRGDDGLDELVAPPNPSPLLVTKLTDVGEFFYIFPRGCREERTGASPSSNGKAKAQNGKKL
jgi:hypothetical protein